MNLRRLFLAVYLAFFAGLGVTMGVFFYDARAEYERLRGIEAQDASRLAAAEARLREQEIVLERLRHDPGYVERLIRRNLGYAKPNEYIFRFEDGADGP